MADDGKRIEWKLEVSVVDPEGDAPKVTLDNEKIPIHFYAKGGSGPERVPREGGTKTIPLITTQDKGDIRFLLIRSSSYAPIDADEDKKVRYEVDIDSTFQPGIDTWVPLDGPQLFCNGAAKWFRDTPNYLHIQNGHTEDVEVEVLIGRYAVT